MDPATIGLVVRAAASALTDENTRKKIGWVIVAILSPVIVLAVLLFSLFSGAAAHNEAAVEYAFYGGAPAAGTPLDFQNQLTDTQHKFSELDTVVSDLNSQAEDGVMLDSTRLKAVLYALTYSGDSPRLSDMSAFADCFVTYEARTYTVTTGDGAVVEESRVVAVPASLDMAYQNLSRLYGEEMTLEIRENAEKVYQKVIGESGSEGGGIPIPPGPPLVGADGFCSPLGAGWQERVSSEYGWRTCPYHGRELHSGLDMAAPAGTSIAAALPGTVVTSKYSSSLGNYTEIDHGGGLTTGYAHQSKRLVAVGDTVEAGQMIGLVGSTGNSTGPHLHLEVRVDGQLQDPRYYLP